MIRRFDTSVYEPSWFEVIFGAILSVVIGVALGAVLLAARPVVAVKVLPKLEERDPRAVYFIEGGKDTAKAKEMAAKRRAFSEGQSVSLAEEHLNSLMPVNSPVKFPVPAPLLASNQTQRPDQSKSKTSEKPKSAEKSGKEPAASAETVVIGSPNFRIADNVLQVAVPLEFHLVGLSFTAVAQARGGIVKRDTGFVFDPSELLLGSLPLHRFPFLASWARGKIPPPPVPDELRAAWEKLAAVTIEGKTLKLTVP
jgi:hypothetical protein